MGLFMRVLITSISSSNSKGASAHCFFWSIWQLEGTRQWQFLLYLCHTLHAIHHKYLKKFKILNLISKLEFSNFLYLMYKNPSSDITKEIHPVPLPALLDITPATVVLMGILLNIQF